MNLPRKTDSAAPDGDGAVERLLASFAPRPSRLDRDRLMFLAGQAAATAESPAIESAAVVPVAEPVRGDAPVRPEPPLHRTPWYWPASTVASSLAALAFALLLFRGDATRRGSGSFEPRGFAPAVPSAAGPRAPGDAPQVARDASDTPAADAPNQPSAAPAIVEAPPDSFARLRAVAALGASPDSLPPAPTARGRADDPPSDYLRAVRSALERPQSLSASVRF